VWGEFSTPVSIQMSLYSIPFYRALEDQLGYPCELSAARLFILRYLDKQWRICGQISGRK